MDSRRETWGWRNCCVAHPILPKRTQSGNVPCSTGHLNSSLGQVIRVSSSRTGLNSWLLRAHCPVPTELDGPVAQLGRRMSPGRGTDHTPKSVLPDPRLPSFPTPTPPPPLPVPVPRCLPAAALLGLGFPGGASKHGPRDWASSPTPTGTLDKPLTALILGCFMLKSQMLDHSHS